MRIFEALLDLLFPPRCAFCRRLLSDGVRGVCGACRGRLPWVPLTAQDSAIKALAKCVAPLYYEGTVRESLLRYKFSGLTAYGQVYAEFVAKCIDENEISCDIITWAPLSRRRLRKRGYDQARLIAEAAASILSLPCEGLLKKTRHTRPQSSIDGAAARATNAAGVYACTNPERVGGRRVLIIDDIVTTGSTLSECAGVLRAAGADAVYAAAVARSRNI